MVCARTVSRLIWRGVWPIASNSTTRNQSVLSIELFIRFHAMFSQMHSAQRALIECRKMRLAFFGL